MLTAKVDLLQEKTGEKYGYLPRECNLPQSLAKFSVNMFSHEIY